MPAASVKRYWDWLSAETPLCPCGRVAEHLHHIIHVNYQRITKDHMLVVRLCADCHEGKSGVHGLGGERPFLEATGTDLVALSILNRHNFEVRAR